LNELLGRRELELAYTVQVNGLTCKPKIMCVLHGEPTLGGAADRLGEA
jgi:hypothetical protein